LSTVGSIFRIEKAQSPAAACNRAACTTMGRTEEAGL
jgi:hypothetical protein